MDLNKKRKLYQAILRVNDSRCGDCAFCGCCKVDHFTGCVVYDAIEFKILDKKSRMVRLADMIRNELNVDVVLEDDKIVDCTL